jgi:hypothetical protein
MKHKFNGSGSQTFYYGHPSKSFLMREEADGDSTPKMRTEESAAKVNVC